MLDQSKDQYLASIRRGANVSRRGQTIRGLVGKVDKSEPDPYPQYNKGDLIEAFCKLYEESTGRTWQDIDDNPIDKLDSIIAEIKKWR